jgi:hypothetical protein
VDLQIKKSNRNKGGLENKTKEKHNKFCYSFLETSKTQLDDFLNKKRNKLGKM